MPPAITMRYYRSLQFEKIPMSIERQRAVLQQQLDDIMAIAEIKRNRGDRFSVKQLEKTKKTCKQSWISSTIRSRKDDVVTFEELGVDSSCDEATTIKICIFILKCGM